MEKYTAVTLSAIHTETKTKYNKVALLTHKQYRIMF